ncbi:5-epiaristolochene 1,3-dihydroxylase [Platanthera zijinensis]|uniref:5-epiaristolochene 1,3-dihydroxylase n=1 Tax=Platanthera zijinensis TaxID=2320716 RepID=A0AAP0BIC2_9ASPA
MDLPSSMALLAQPLLVIILILIFSGFRRRRGANPNNLPPGPTPFPIIGNLHNLKGLPYLAFHRISKKYGPIMYLKLGQVPSIVVSSADMASEILKSQDSVFCSRSQVTALKILTYGGQDIAFSPFNDHWKQLKRLCNAELFSLAKVQSLEAIRRDEVNALVNTITKACSRKEAVNLNEALLCYANNIIFRVLFGKRISADGECESNPLKNLLGELGCLMAEIGAGDLFPSLGWVDVLTGWRRKIGRTFEKMDLVFEEEIRERLPMKSSAGGGGGGGVSASSVHHGDFLDTLLFHQSLHEASDHEEDAHQTLTINDIKAIFMNMFTAGTNAVSATVEWGMTRLMKNPAAMKKAQAEVRRVVGDKGKVEESDLQHLHYLKMVIKESLRLHPPGPLPPPRECMKDTKVAGYNIPAKTRVYVSVWSIGRDPKYWGDDAEDFRPERFENNEVNFKGAHMEFIPFGAGRRICPAISLAMASVELVYATLLYEFDWALPDGMVKEDIDLAGNSGLALTKKVPLVAVPTTP